VHAQDTLGNTVERAAPEVAAGDAGKILDPFEHFAGGFVGKGEQENFTRLHTLMEQVGHAVGEGAGFAGSRTGQHQCGTRLGSDGGVLLVVEFGAKIDGGEHWGGVVGWGDESCCLGAGRLRVAGIAGQQVGVTGGGSFSSGFRSQVSALPVLLFSGELGTSKLKTRLHGLTLHNSYDVILQ